MCVVKHYAMLPTVRLSLQNAKEKGLSSHKINSILLLLVFFIFFIYLFFFFFFFFFQNEVYKVQTQNQKHPYIKTCIWQCVLCKVTRDFRILTLEFYVLSFRFCVLCYLLWHVRFAS